MVAHALHLRRKLEGEGKDLKPIDKALEGVVQVEKVLGN